MIKRIVHITALILATAGLLISLAFSARESEKMPCTDIEIAIDHASGNFFVSNQDVREMVWSKGDSLIGRPLTSIPIALYERHIQADPSVSRAEVFTKHNGAIGIKVYQREPILRIITSEDESFYLDKTGWLMPISENYTARVPIANGFIIERQFEMQRHQVNTMADSLKRISCLDDLFQLADFIRSSPFWKAQIQQIRVEANGEFTLIPTVGDHHILFGGTDKMDQKFKKLLLFYHKGLNTTGWDQYSHINLKYKDQVICTKKIS